MLTKYIVTKYNSGYMVEKRIMFFLSWPVEYFSNLDEAIARAKRGEEGGKVVWNGK